MADSDPEIVFHARQNGGGERFLVDNNKRHHHNDSSNESDTDDRVDHHSPLQEEVTFNPERNDRIPDYERIRVRPRVNRSTLENKILIKPDVFNGEGDWDSYKTHFEICAELGEWSPRVMALTLASRLQGQAQIFYMNLPDQQKYCYPELVKQLSQRFSYVRQQSKWAALLESCQRGQGESISALGDEIKRLTRKAYSNLDPMAQETIALKQLYKSISPEMRYNCIREPCTTVAQAVDLIEIYEGVMGGEGNKKKNMVRMARDETEKHGELKTIETGLTEVQQTMKQVIKRIEKLEAKNRRACYVCQSFDHLSYDCPENRRQDNNRYQQSKQSYKKSYNSQQSSN